MAAYNKSINQVFSPNVINDLITNGKSEVYDFVVNRCINEPYRKTNGQILGEIYQYLGKNHRNEYYYINTLLNKLLEGIHNVNTTTALSQVRVANHIADFVMINGEARAYEIKSNLDNFVRLNDQLSDYYKVFSKVSILVSSKERDNACSVLEKLGAMGDNVGVYVLSENNTIFCKSKSREPVEYNDKLNHRSLFSLMRKKEYEAVIESCFHELPVTAPVFYYRECLKMFSLIPILEAQKLTVMQLKKRKSISKSLFDEIPMELKSAVYFSNLTKKIDSINDFLTKPYQEVGICISHI